MLEKILLVLLISLINSDTVEIKYLAESLEINNRPNFLLCIKFPEKLKQSDGMFLLLDCEEKNATINKTLYFNYLDESCENLNSQDINFNNISGEFYYNDNEPNLEENRKGIHEEYKIIKKEDNKNYVLILLKDFNGTKINLQYGKLSRRIVLVIIIVCVIVTIFILVAAVIIFIKYYLQKKKPQTQDEYKASLVDDPMELKEQN